jgi:hypothetical protein
MRLFRLAVNFYTVGHEATRSAAGVVATAMDKDQRRCRIVTPVRVMQPQALGFIEAVCWTR